METHLCTDHEKAFDSTQTYFIWYFKIYKYSRYIIKGNSKHIHTKQNINKI